MFIILSLEYSYWFVVLSGRQSDKHFYPNFIVICFNRNLPEFGLSQYIWDCQRCTTEFNLLKVINTENLKLVPLLTVYDYNMIVQIILLRSINRKDVNYFAVWLLLFFFYIKKTCQLLIPEITFASFLTYR